MFRDQVGRARAKSIKDSSYHFLLHSALSFKPLTSSRHTNPKVGGNQRLGKSFRVKGKEMVDSLPGGYSPPGLGSQKRTRDPPPKVDPGSPAAAVVLFW